jgi:hypothetical protein
MFVRSDDRIAKPDVGKDDAFTRSAFFDVPVDVNRVLRMARKMNERCENNGMNELAYFIHLP